MLITTKRCRVFDEWIKHLPVMGGGRVIGMVTFSDLLRKKNHGTMELLQTIEQSTYDTIHELKPAM